MADLVGAFFGARRQGKSTQVKHFLRFGGRARFMVFDPMNEYGAVASAAPNLRELAARARGEGSLAVRYVPPRGTEKQLAARFDAFCSIAYDVGNLAAVVEELQLVTRPTWAPPAWSDCTLRGGHRGLAIVGISQRPASVDKNFLSNCSSISTCRLNFDDDVLCVARMLGVPRERVAALQTYQFIARDMGTGELFEGNTGPMHAELSRKAKRK